MIYSHHTVYWAVSMCQLKLGRSSISENWANLQGSAELNLRPCLQKLILKKSALTWFLTKAMKWFDMKLLASVVNGCSPDPCSFLEIILWCLLVLGRSWDKTVFPIFLPKRNVEDRSLKSSRNISEEKSTKEVPAKLLLMASEIFPKINGFYAATLVA